MMFQREVVSVAMIAAVMLACSTSGTGEDDGGHGGAAGEEQNAGGGGGDTGGDQGGPGGSSPAGGDGGNVGGGGGGNAQAGTGGNATGGNATGGNATGGNATGGNAATGGTGGGTPVAVPCAERPYCNDFESVNAGARPAGTVDVKSGNTLRVANDKAVSGSKSLYIEASSGAARYSFSVPKLQNPKSISYVRMNLWLDGLPGGVAPGHWDLIAVGGPSKTSEGALLNVAVKFGGIRDVSSRLLYVGSGADCQKGGGSQIPTKKWICVEMRVDETHPTKPYNVTVDGVDLPGLQLAVEDNGAFCSSIGAPFGSWYVPDGQTFTIGWNYYHTQGRAVKMWIDDVVVDEQPIGCK